MKNITLIVGILGALLAVSCTSDSPLPVPPGKGAFVPTLSAYRLGPRVGASTTLRFTTTDISEDEETTTIGSDYRFTVVDTAFRMPSGKVCYAVKRETITNGDVRLTDTTYHWVGERDLITYERLTDTIGRRRLATPLLPGTRFILRDNLGDVESNTYVLRTLADTVRTPVTSFLNCAHVRMLSTTADNVSTTQFADEVWLAPGFGIVRQVQTRIVTSKSTGKASATILEFLLIARSS